MQNKWKFLLCLLVVWFVATVLLGDGRSYCSDGTITFSKGSGTCSWHKGKGTQPNLKIVNFIFLVAIAIWVYSAFLRGSGRFTQSRPEEQKPTLPTSVQKMDVRALRPTFQSPPPKPSMLPPADPPTQPVCPKCDGPMVLRLAKKGRNRGKSFWGCRNFPRCNGVVNYSESSIVFENIGTNTNENN